MRSRKIAWIAITLMTVPAIQPGALAAAQQVAAEVQPGAAAAPSTTQTGTTVSGTAVRTNMKPLPAATVRLRQYDSTTILKTATTGPYGEFAFAGVQPGNYLLELVDFSGRLLGTAPPFAVTGNAPVAAVSVMASALGASEAAAAGGFSLFGLGSTTSWAVLGAAGAAAVTAVTVNKSEASPSR